MKERKKQEKIVLTGGGTGGHVFPLVTVADELAKSLPEIEILYYGSGLEIETSAIKSSKIKYRKILCGKFRRNFSFVTVFQNLGDLILLKLGIFQSIYLLIKDKPSLIFSKGGYVSLPVVCAAKILSIPIILHESDILMGLANRIAARFARRILVSFDPNIFTDNIKFKATRSGIPLRREFDRIFEENKEVRSGHILFIGGSSGARSLNTQIFEIAEELLEKNDIVHLTGKLDFGRSQLFRKSLPDHLRKKYHNIEFSDDVPELMRDASVIVSRCGATAIFEAASSRKSTIFAPLTSAVGTHQLVNAMFLEQLKLAKIHLPNDSSEMLLKKIVHCLEDKKPSPLSRIYFPKSAQYISLLLSDELERSRILKLKKVFLIGINGVSMRGLAKILKKMGVKVAGSDIKYGGHNAENITDDIDLVVYSSAANRQSPAVVEHERAKKLGIETIKRSQMIGRLMRGYEGISISGMHGKTTITSLVSRTFENIGLNPSYLIGAEQDDFNKTAHLGQNKLFIAEACEYDDSFLDFPTYVAVISNIEEEHLDYFKGGLKEIKDHFGQFIRNIYPGGALVFCGDDSNTFDVVRQNVEELEKKNIKIISYGFKPSSDISVLDYNVKDNKVAFTIRNEIDKFEFESTIAGKHFALNVAATVAVAGFYKISPSEVLRIVSRYQGASRRFTKIGLRKGVIVYDDYAHHPTEISATLEALSELYPKKRKILIFQPHQQSRFNEFFDGFVKSISNSQIDFVGIMPVFKVPGRDVEENYTSEDLVEKINSKNQIEATSLSDEFSAVKYLDTIAKKDDIIMTMGATDVWKIGEKWLGKQR